MVRPIDGGVRPRVQPLRGSSYSRSAHVRLIRSQRESRYPIMRGPYFGSENNAHRILNILSAAPETAFRSRDGKSAFSFSTQWTRGPLFFSGPRGTARNFWNGRSGL